MVEKAESAGFNTPPPTGHSLLKDYFGVNLSLLPPHDGGNYYSFDPSSFTPTNHTSTVNYTASDWYGNWDFNDWDTTTVWGTEPSGGEWYDVEAMYLDNDQYNVYLAIVTSCPFYKNWTSEISDAPAGVGIYEPRYSDFPLENRFVIPGDIIIDLGMNPRDEKDERMTSYDFGVDLVHEQRNPKDQNATDIWNDPHQHNILGMRDNDIGHTLYKTMADPGGQDIGDPYLDIPGNPMYDWYTANVHEESEWQHTNFDPFSSWSNMPSPIGNCTINYYKYNFSSDHRENNADTYIIEATIPISLLESSGATIRP